MPGGGGGGGAFQVDPFSSQNLSRLEVGARAIGVGGRVGVRVVEGN